LAKASSLLDDLQREEKLGLNWNQSAKPAQNKLEDDWRAPAATKKQDSPKRKPISDKAESYGNCDNYEDDFDDDIEEDLPVDDNQVLDDDKGNGASG
jgi:hypothetical protein